MVVLKRLSEAEADGDRIWGVIRGSAVNQNGVSAGLTVPNGPSQERVMEEALAQGGFLPSEVDYLEAHATGSQLGDPIELNAAAAVYGKGRDREHPLLIGSVKSNIGHAESAAGIAAFIKTVLSMNQGVIPKHLHFQHPNQHVEWDQIPIQVTSEKTAWPTVLGRRPVAGVNAFGLSGTNAHVLIEGYGPPLDAATARNYTPLPRGAPQSVPIPLPESVIDLPISSEELMERTARFLPLSAKSADALRELAERYLSWFGGEEGSASDERLADLAWTAGVGRSHFPHRAGLVFSNAEQLRQGLHALAGAQEALDQPLSDSATRVAFAYTGKGGEWIGLGEGIYRSEPVARAVLNRCDELMREDREISLLKVMFGRDGIENDLNGPEWLGPAIYALECSLTAQWASVGIRPNLIVGHGPGALAAAQAAGVFSVEDGLRLAMAQGDLLRETRLEEDTQAATENLKVTLADIKVSAPSISLLSNVTCRVVESVGELDINYWARQRDDTVHCSDYARMLAEVGIDLLVGVGPHTTLARAIGDTWPKPTEKPTVLSTLASSADDAEAPASDDGFVRSVAGAYEAGLAISFAGLFAGEVRRRISLPTYPFQRRTHWF